MHLYTGRNKIIKLFEDKYIKPTNFPYNAEPEPELEKCESEYKPKYVPEFEESITERIKK